MNSNTNTNSFSKNLKSIDIAKFAAAILVIAIHCTAFGTGGDSFISLYVDLVARLAVPFFFACSGYFFFSGLQYKNNKIERCKANKDKFKKYFVRICLLYIVWSAIYLLWQIPQWNATGWLSVNAFIDYAIAFFRLGSYYHFWYILDLIYSVIFGYILLSVLKKKTVLLIAVVLYILGIFTYSYNWIDIMPVNMINEAANFAQELWNSATRAFPLMFIGYYYGTAKFSFQKNKNIILFAVSYIFLITEMFLLKKFTPNTENLSFIIFTVPCEIFLFSSIRSVVLKSTKSFSVLRNASTVIYCLHPMIINLLGLIPAVNGNYIILNYFIVSVISVILSLVIVKISNYKRFKFLKILY